MPPRFASRCMEPPLGLAYLRLMTCSREDEIAYEPSPPTSLRRAFTPSNPTATSCPHLIPYTNTHTPTRHIPKYTQTIQSCTFPPPSSLPSAPASASTPPLWHRLATMSK